MASNDGVLIGNVSWQDADGIFHNARGIVVELLDSNQQALAAVFTDAEGNYEFDALPVGASYSIKAYATGKSNQDLAGFHRVINQNKELYFIESDEFTVEEEDGSTVLQFNEVLNTNPAAGAFSIADALYTAEIFSEEIFDQTQTVSVILDEDNQRTFQIDDEIHLEPGYAFSWDVIHHEYGHFIATQYQLDGKGDDADFDGSHNPLESLIGTGSPPRSKRDGGVLAWSEGFATYLPLAIQAIAQETRSSLIQEATVFDAKYVTALDNPEKNYDIDIAFGFDLGFGEGHEISIARILWDLADGQDELHDQIDLGHSGLIDIIQNQADRRDPTRFDLNDLWNYFYDEFQASNPAELVKYGAIFQEHSISPVPETLQASTISETSPPTFRWQPGNQANGNANDEFTVYIFNSDFSDRLESSLDQIQAIASDALFTWTPSVNAWQSFVNQSQINGLNNSFHLVVAGSDTQDAEGNEFADFEITGPYWSAAASFEVTADNPSNEQPTMYTGGNLDQIQTGLATSLATLGEALDREVFNRKLPLIGSGLQEFSKFLEGISSAIDSALQGIAPNNVDAVEQALLSALGADGLNILTGDTIEVVEATDEVEFTLPIGTSLNLADEAIAFDLGLPGLGFSLDEGSTVQTQLDFGTNLTFGVRQDTGFYMATDAEDDITLGVSAAIPDLQAKGELGFLRFNVSDEDADDNAENDRVDVDADGFAPTLFEAAIAVDLGDLNSPSNLINKAVINGNADINLNLGADLGTSVLPGVNTDLNIGWDFENLDLADLASDALGEVDVEFNNISLDVGSLFDNFIGDIFGEVQKVTNTRPIKNIVDVLQTRVPVLDNFGRSFLDTTGGLSGGPDGKVTLLDIVDIMLGDRASLDFIGAVSSFIELVNKIPTDETNLLIPLGGFTFNNDANYFASKPELDFSSIIDLGDTDIDFLDELQKFIDEGSEWAEDAFAFLEADVSEADGLSFPIIDDPKESAFKLLIGQDVDLFKYDIPELAFQTGFEVYFPVIGPLGVSLQGNLGAGIDLDLGYSTKGIREGGFEDTLYGFYIGTEARDVPTPNTEEGDDPDDVQFIPFEPIAEVDASLEGFAAISAFFASFGVGGGVFGDLSLHLDDGDDTDGRVYLNEFDPSCIFDPLAGSVSAGLSAFIKIGFGPFGYKKRFNISKKTLLSFQVGCDSDQDVGLASFDATDPSALRLHAGSDANRRIKELRAEKAEFFTVRPAAYENAPEGLFVVSSFGIDDDGLQPDGSGGFFNPAKIVAETGSDEDIVVIADEVLVAADIDGGGKDDQIYGGSGHDTLRGRKGEDYIHGGVGNDFIFGGKNDDVLIGGSGADLIDGGKEDNQDGKPRYGDQTSYIDSPAGVVFAKGTELPLGLALPEGFDLKNRAFFVGTGGFAEGDILIDIEYIEGTHYDDVIQGDKERNTFEGFGGNDRLFGGGGDDFLIGGAGADTIDGGEGGEKEGDRTSYLTSPAAVYIDLERRIFRGGDADGDVLVNIEHVQGSVFDDFMRGNEDDNELNGYAGDDTIVGGLGKDTFDGGEGVDWLKYSFSTNPDGVKVSLDSGKGSLGDANGDKIAFVQELEDPEDPESDLINTEFSTFENLAGSRGDDDLEGDIGNNIIEGLAGDDDVRGEAGNDTLIGGEGADRFYGGDGLDLADYSDSPSGVTVNLAEHIKDNKTATPTASGGHAEGDTFEHDNNDRSTVENLLGTGFDDRLTGDAGNNDINPGLSGSVGDQVDGGQGGGDRLILDYSLNDVGTGIIGGYLPTIPSFPTGSSSNGMGTFTRSTSDGSTILDQVSFTNIERLKIIGTAQNDSIRSGEGNDIIVTGAGDDYIFGGLGSNRIYAGDGDDTVVDQRLGVALPPSVLPPLPSNTQNPIIDLDGGRGTDTLNVSLSRKDSDITLQFSENFASNSQQQITVTDGTVNIRNFEILEDITTGDGNDKLSQFGRFDNRFIAGRGSDEVNPGLGIDDVSGGDGNNDLLVLDYSIEDTGTGVQYIKDFNPDSLPDFDTSIDLDELPNLADRTTYNRFPTENDSSDLNSFYVRASEDGDAILDQVRFRQFERFDIKGTEKNDGLVGGDGDDTLKGKKGDDILIGNLGNDSLIGGSGDDILVAVSNFKCRTIDENGKALTENDTLTGGLGSDQFWLTDSTLTFRSGFATITDFNPGEDTIHLYSDNPNDFEEARERYSLESISTDELSGVGIFYDSFQLLSTNNEVAPLALFVEPSKVLIGFIENADEIEFNTQNFEFHQRNGCTVLE